MQYHLSKDSRQKIAIKNSVVFRNTNNELLERDMKMILLTTASKRIKHLGIN